MKKVIYAFEILFILGAIFSLFEPELTDYFLCYIIMAIVLHIVRKKIKESKPSSLSQKELNYIKSENMESNYLINEYFLKPFLTSYEIDFYNKIKELENDYIIIPQVNLASIIDKKQYNKRTYRNELFRNIDFGIFNKKFEILLLIEINDKSHNSMSRKDRDLKVQKIVNDCNIPLIKFYTYYPNEKNYVLNRIKQHLYIETIETEKIQNIK